MDGEGDVSEDKTKEGNVNKRREVGGERGKRGKRDKAS